MTPSDVFLILIYIWLSGILFNVISDGGVLNDN